MSNSSIGSVESVIYGGVTSNVVRDMNVEAIEEVKDGEEQTPSRKVEGDDVDDNDFPDELGDDVIDEGVTTNNMCTFDKIK